jgi:glycosyltransferase 2 family protein
VLKVPVLWFKSARWAVAIHRATGRPVMGAFSASMIGSAANLILPARLGEWARVSVIHKRNCTGRTLALAALIATQLFDLLLLASCFLVFSARATGRLAGLHLPAIGLVWVVLCALALAALLQRKAAAVSCWYDLICRKMPASLNRLFAQKLQFCLQGVKSLGSGRALMWISLLTLLAWGVESVSVFAVLEAFHIEATALMTMMLVVASNLSFLVPVTPGNIGVVQAINVLLLGTFGVPEAPALAYGVAHQGIFYVVIFGLGLICFYREGMSLNLLGRAGRESGVEEVSPVPQP